MTYSINNTQDQNLVNLEEKDTRSLAGLVLAGKGVINYGEILNENLVKLLEKFSNLTPPNDGLPGQLWYNPETDVLQIKTSTTNAQSSWRALGAPTVSTSPPTNPSDGDLWWNSTPGLGQLKIWVDNDWIVVGPNNLLEQGLTGCFIDVLQGNTVIKILVNSETIAIISDAEFTLTTPLEGFFTNIKSGLNLRVENQLQNISLAKLDISQDAIIPKEDLTVTLGTASLKFNEIYATNLYGTATSATTVDTAINTNTALQSQSIQPSQDTDNTDASRYPIFVPSTNGYNATQVDSNLTYKPFSNTLYVDKIYVESITNQTTGTTGPFEVTGTNEIVGLRAETASRWHTARTISLTGDMSHTGSPSNVDGSANLVIDTEINADKVVMGVNTSGDYVRVINQVGGDTITITGMSAESSNVTVTNDGVRSIVAGTAIDVNNNTGSVIVNNNGVISINDSFGAVKIPVRTYNLTRLASDVGSYSKSVYLEKGYWQLTLQVDARVLDTIDHYYSVIQTATLGVTTVSATITFAKSQTPAVNGSNRAYYGKQIGIGSLDVGTAGTYTMIISAPTFAGTGALLSGPVAQFKAELIEGGIGGSLGTTTVGIAADPPGPPAPVGPGGANDVISTF